MTRWHLEQKVAAPRETQVGNVRYAEVLLEPSGRSKGCGIVEFEDANEAAAAIRELNDSELDGRQIYVVRARRPAWCPARLVRGIDDDDAARCLEPRTGGGLGQKNPCSSKASPLAVNCTPFFFVFLYQSVKNVR